MPTHILKQRSRKMKSFFNYVFRVIAIAYFPMLFIASFIPKATDGGTSYALNLLFFFLYSFPFYCVFLEIGSTVDSIPTFGQKTVAERVIHIIRLILSAVILLTLINIWDLLYIALTASLALLVFKALTLIIFRPARANDEIIKTPRFWITVVAVIIAISCAFLIIQVVIDSKNRPDPLEPIQICVSDGCDAA